MQGREEREEDDKQTDALGAAIFHATHAFINGSQRGCVLSDVQPWKTPASHWHVVPPGSPC